MKYSQTLKSRSIRMNYYQFVCSFVFSCRFIGIKRFRFVWFINFFNRHQTSLKQFKNNRNLSLPFTRAFNFPQLINAKSLVITTSSNYYISTENNCNTFLLENLYRFNISQLRFKQLIPIKQDLTLC